MIFYYLDASAWVKRYYREPGSDRVAELFDGQQTLACATLGVVEITATLARKRKAGELSAHEFDEKAQTLSEDWEQFIEVRLTDEVARRARELAASLALRGADAVHLASALHLEQRFVDKDDVLVLVASDAELLEAGRLSGVSTINLQYETSLDSAKTSAADRIADIRRTRPNAYQRWTTEDDERLGTEYRRGTGTRELAALFMRQPSAIRSRLRRLGLTEER